MIYQELEQLEALVEKVVELQMTDDGFKFVEVIKDEEAYNELKQGIIKQGAEKLCKYRQNLNNASEGLKNEIKRIQAQLKRVEAKQLNADRFLLDCLDMSGNDKLYAGTFTVGTRKSTSVEVVDNFSNKEYITVKTTESVDKVKLKEALKSGLTVEGASLVEKKNLSVK